MKRTVIVTGARGGIGESTAQKFLDLGDRVYGTDLAFDETPHDFTEVICDVTDPDAVSGLVERVVSETGRMDVLVNNAGIRVVKDVINTTIEEWDRMMAVNLTAVFLGCKFALPHMLEQASGVIVNVASTAGLNPIPNRAAYCANKAGVIGLTRQMALQYARQGVRVNAICPGATSTPFSRKNFEAQADPAAAEAAFSSRLPIGRFARAEEQANAIAYLASDKASFITGSILDVDGGSNLVTAHVGDGSR
jgi:NAD(P)-dependent dehydrogenase (short-subunit alcohol dehydrogenase family)